MKRGEVILVGILISLMIMLIMVSADDFNVGVEVDDGELGSEKGFFYSVFVNPLLELFQTFGVVTGGECETGYGW